MPRDSEQSLVFRLDHSITIYHNSDVRKLLNHHGISLTFRIDLVSKTQFSPGCHVPFWGSVTFLSFCPWENINRQLSFLSSVLRGQREHRPHPVPEVVQGKKLLPFQPTLQAGQQRLQKWVGGWAEAQLWPALDSCNWCHNIEHSQGLSRQVA